MFVPIVGSLVMGFNPAETTRRKAMGAMANTDLALRVARKVSQVILKVMQSICKRVFQKQIHVLRQNDIQILGCKRI